MKLPPPLSWLWAAWKKFGEILGKIMSKIILTVLWIVGFGLYGIIRKVAVLFMKKEGFKESYWVPATPPQPGDLHRQF
jgi:hypothetical protein